MLIGVTGPAGAGKDTASEYIEKSLGVTHISGGDILRDMLRSLNYEPKKSAIGDFGTFLRTHYGGGTVLLRVIEKSNGAKHVVASGFRSVAEAQFIKDRGGVIIYIDATARLRHARIVSRQRKYENLSSEDLKLLDAQEHRSSKPMAENLDSVKKIADEIITNDGELSLLFQKLDIVIKKLAS